MQIYLSYNLCDSSRILDINIIVTLLKIFYEGKMYDIFNAY